ncbi:MAG TPA: cell division ATP-binding protein FtsE [Armatimonadota bacterium]|jgi:cell division transport system ATP-binding protein
MIDAEEVSLTYPKGVQALDRVTLKVAPGEFAFIVGPTGSGKSTFLKLLYREEVPDTGRLKVDGIDVPALRRGHVPFLRRRLGVVFQDFRLLPQRTVEENVAFALHVTGATRRRLRTRVQEVLQEVGLADRSRAYPHELSGGEQQRVSLARALVHQPPLLLADEPTGNLDPTTSWEIVQLLSAINEQGTTVVMATHAQDMVDRMHRRVIFFENGQIVGDVKEGGYLRDTQPA